MNNYKRLGGQYISYELSDREITNHVNRGGFEPNKRTDIESMSIGGYLPKSPEDNPCFNYSINGDDTGFEWYWADMPKSFRAKLWCEAKPPHVPGTAPDTSLHLGNERRAWLQEQGGIQPIITRLIDDAMKS